LEARTTAVNRSVPVLIKFFILNWFIVSYFTA
jgi:hypothetical protein